MAYIESMRSLREPQLPETILWDDLMLVMREQVSRVLSHFGELVVNKISGVLVAIQSGRLHPRIRPSARTAALKHRLPSATQSHSARSAARNALPRSA